MIDGNNYGINSDSDCANSYDNVLEIQNWLLEYRKTDNEQIKKKLKGLITMAFMPLVAKVARSFARRSSDPVEDIVQVGTVGLLKAVDSYENSKNASFKTYASYLITGEIRHYLRDASSMIRAPREIIELSYRIHKITTELTQILGHAPSDEQLAHALEMPQKKIQEASDLDRRTTAISIDHNPMQEMEGGGNLPFLESIPDESQNLGQEVVENRLILNEAIKTLPVESQKIITMCFYDGLTQKEVSDKLNISQMQVSRKMKKALSKLFDFVTSRGIVPYE